MPRPLRTPAISAQRGLTLVELMISVTIGLIITLAIGYLYTGSRQTYRMNDNVARMQENGRYAMEMISRDVRMAGYWGCAGMTISSPVNTLNNATDYAYKFDVPVQGHEATVATWSPAISITGAIIGTDILTVRGVYGDGVTVVQHPGGTPPGSADLKVSAGSGLAAGDIVLVSDCSNAAVFQITNLNTSAGFDNVVHNTGLGVPGNATKALGKEYVGGEILRIATFTYYIGLNPAGRPALYRLSNGAAEELVENVENMQVTYGVDTDGDRAVDEYRTANSVTDWKHVRSVRVRLLLVSPDDNLVSPPQTYRYLDTTGDGIPDPVTATDNRLRYVFTGTVGIRNLLP
ncbi:MAG: PilW family protein [Thiobacillaceae bacterium]